MVPLSLTKEEMEHINSFECNGRLIVPIVNGKPRDGAHVHYPFNIEFWEFILNDFLFSK